MTDQFKFRCRVVSCISMIAALSIGVSVGTAQTMQPQYGAPPPTLYAPSRQGPEEPYLPPAMPNSVAESVAPCGGDFGMLGNLEAARHGVAQANPNDGPVCD